MSSRTRSSERHEFPVPATWGVNLNPTETSQVVLCSWDAADQLSAYSQSWHERRGLGDPMPRLSRVTPDCEVSARLSNAPKPREGVDCEISFASG